MTRDPLADHYKRSHQLMLWLSMADTCKLEEEGKLANLAVFWEDGICWTRGRPGIDGLEAMLGVSKLPVLSSSFWKDSLIFDSLSSMVCIRLR